MELRFDGDSIDLHGKRGYKLSTPKGGHITLTDIHNYLVRRNGGGAYFVLVNANSGELEGKIKDAFIFEADLSLLE
jgi:hypothetical protein